MKKTAKILSLALCFILALSAVGCSSKKGKTPVLKVGINGEVGPVWDSITERMAAEGITVEVLTFTDYIIPNTALADGDIDANNFQTEIFFKSFLKNSGADLSILCYTILAPMGIYPGKAGNLEDIPEGGRIGIPNDESNGGRALILLQEAGLIAIDPEKGLLPSVDDITDNPKNLEIIPLAAGQIYASLDELHVGVINNNYAIAAGLIPKGDSIFFESVEMEHASNYYNIIAVRTEDLDKTEIQKLREIYSTQTTRDKIEEQYKGSAIPAF